jgi:hypothetical protein
VEVLGKNDQDTLYAYVAVAGPKSKADYISANILVGIIKE